MIDSPHTRIDEHRSALGCDRGRGSRLGRKNSAKARKTNEMSDNDENNDAHMM